MQTNENTIFFDGYCPESSLRGKIVNMRLNEDDFWESVETGLQITSFPPFAAILRWRGKGMFKLHEQLASQHHKGLLLTETRWERDQEIHPNQQALLDNQFDLEYYIHQVYDTYELYEADKFNPADEVLKRQEDYLQGIATEEWMYLVALYKLVVNKGITSSNFQTFHEKLYDMGVIFDFDWSKWMEGAKSLEDPEADYSNKTLLECSMYFTHIFRSDRFNDIAIKRSFSNGAITKILQRIEELT